MIRRVNRPAGTIAFICSHLPRKCGIATFTRDLIRNVGAAAGNGFKPIVIALDSGIGHQYDESVAMVVRRNVRGDYIRAADYLNSLDNVHAVSIQHEFGLFGGQAGSYLNILLERLNKPVISTLHTVLERPTQEYFSSKLNLCQASEKLVVMNHRGLSMLSDVYGIPQSKINLIPHGIPDLPFADSEQCKGKLGLTGRIVILTFGLLGPNKGIEVMLRSMPRIIEADPNVLYVILGATHPELVRSEGLSYKSRLDEIIGELGLTDNVAFHHRFVDDSELHDFLAATDIYVTPYLHAEQLTSGTLAFAVGTGKAVVSTPYWAAQELLAQGRGKLVRFDDPEHTAEAIIEILTAKSDFDEMRRRAYDYGRAITWPKVGRQYWKLFNEFVHSDTDNVPAFTDAANLRRRPAIRPSQTQTALQNS